MATTIIIPSGLCQCGCGEPTRAALQTSTAQGYVKGQPRRFVAGHQARKTERWELRDCGHTTPCHLWLLRVDAQGYGREWHPTRQAISSAHIVAWEAVNGPVPDGLHLDHLCHDAHACAGGPTCIHRRCRNPEHLEPVTPLENSRRGNTGAYLLARTHCPRGHAYEGENLFTKSNGGRGCRACQRAACRRSYAKIKAKAGGRTYEARP